LQPRAFFHGFYSLLFTVKRSTYRQRWAWPARRDLVLSPVWKAPLRPEAGIGMGANCQASQRL